MYMYNHYCFIRTSICSYTGIPCQYISTTHNNSNWFEVQCI